MAEDYVDAVLAAFDGRPDVGVLGGRILLFDPDDARVTIDERDHPAEIAPRSFVEAGAVKGANLSFRREALQAIGGFDPELGAGTPFPCEDIDAVASVLWAGYRGRYDPRPVVLHHHRRREPDVPRLRAGYDRGRGAYYAKFLLRPDCRRAYAAGWLQRDPHASEWRGARPAVAGTSIGGRLPVARRKIVSLLVLMPPAIATYCAVALAAAARACLKPKPKDATAHL